MGAGEIISIQDEIIGMQSEIIDALYLELMQYKTMDETEESKGFQLIKKVAEKRRRIENA
jgi:hypothetical protein